MKSVLKYILVFSSTVVLLFMLLTLSAKIPKNAIKDNLNESIDFFRKHTGIYVIKEKKIYSYIHYFADTRKLNIIYCMDSEKPIESILWARYFELVKRDTNVNFINLMMFEKEPNTQYLRYWNGCILFLRPMLTLFNMEQIYRINQIILVLLGLMLIIILTKKSKLLAMIFTLSMVLVSIWYATMCIEYSVMIYVMIIASLVAIKIDGNKNNEQCSKIDEKLYILFFITGIITTFFDFLTTELLTIFVPLLLILIIRKKENRLNDLKVSTKFVMKSFIIWLTGYIGMWIAKWGLASLILHINALDYVKESVTQRIYGLQGMESYELIYGHVISRNFFAIPIVYSIKANFDKLEVRLLLLVSILLLLLFINWKELYKKKYLLIFVLIGITPYVRYLILANHSFRHVPFTFRSQIITIIAFLYIVLENLNYKLMMKKIYLRKKYSKEKNKTIICVNNTDITETTDS